MRASIWFGASALLTLSAPALACSATTPCTIEDRAYFIALPKDTTAAVSAVLYLHGWGGSGAGALRNSDMVEGYLERGYAVIAPDGRPRANGGGRSWAFHPASGRQAEDIAFLQKVRDDVLERFDLDPERLLLAGFSIGGSMVAYTACEAPESFAAYAPLGGNFWRPHPTECAGPVRMLHTHGWSDGTVPLEGRVVNQLPADDPNAFAQGDIFFALDLWRDTNGCRHLKPDRIELTGPFWRRAWERCTEGTALELALFPGGHVIPSEWPALVIDWFEGL